MKKLLFICSIILLTITATSCSNKGELQKDVDRINADLPQTIGPMRLDTLILDNQTLKIVSTVLIDEIEIPTGEQLEVARAGAIKNAKSNKNFEKFIANDISFNFIYKKLDGSLIYEVTITPQELK